MGVYEDKRPTRQGELKGKGYCWADRECWAPGHDKGLQLTAKVDGETME